MSRDYRKLRVFRLADSLAVHIYLATREFPIVERFGLSAQLRRAAVSVACNIVEGSARESTREFRNFLNIAAGSAAEVRYLVDLSWRVKCLPKDDASALVAEYTLLSAQLQTLMRALPRT
jgi:four helix bundle protein